MPISLPVSGRAVEVRHDANILTTTNLTGNIMSSPLRKVAPTRHVCRTSLIGCSCSPSGSGIAAVALECSGPVRSRNQNGLRTEFRQASLALAGLSIQQRPCSRLFDVSARRICFKRRWIIGTAIVAIVMGGDLAGEERGWMGLPVPPASSAGLVEPGQQELPAQLWAHRFTSLSSEMEAQVERVTVREGSRFAAGDVLIGLDCSLPRSMLHQAQAEARAAQRDYETEQRLLARNPAGRSAFDRSAAKLGQASAQVQLQQVRVNRCSIAAPFGGRVVALNVAQHQYVQPGQVLLEIVDDSQLELRFRMPSAWLATRLPGSRLEVAVDQTGQRYPAVLIGIGARVDPASQSVRVTAALDGDFPALSAGMSGRIRFLAP